MPHKFMPPGLAEKLMEIMAKSGAVNCMEVDGVSMSPFIENRQRVIVDHRVEKIEVGDIILFEKTEGECYTPETIEQTQGGEIQNTSAIKNLFIHRVVYVDNDKIITKGDNRYSFDEPISRANVRGKVTVIEKENGEKIFLNEEPWKTISHYIAQISYRMGIFHREMMNEKVLGDVEEFHNRGYKLYLEGKLDEALAMFRSAVALDPQRAISRIDIGEILRQTGKNDEAILHLRLAVEIDRRKTDLSAQAYNIIGNTLCNLGKYEESLEEYNSGIGIAPDFVPLYINRGWAHFKLGKYNEALEDYTKALELEPDNFKATKNIGLLFLTMKRNEEAEKFLRKAIKLDPCDADVMNNLALVRREKGDLSGAEKLVRKALEINPDHYEANFNLGIILERGGNKKEALSIYNRLLKLYPDDLAIQSAITGLVKEHD